MTEHKYTDEEIIRALKCFVAEECPNCDECPFDECCYDCTNKMLNNALDLINRQRAEIERLITLNSQLETDVINANMNLQHITYEFDLLEQEKSVVRAEAIKGFADKLISKSHAMQRLSNGAIYRAVTDGQIEKIAKEMIGETK